MWLTNSSIGKKVIMSVTGIALILFLTFHACMNAVALISPEGYNVVCSALGANWYALVATAGLSVLVVLHFVYAILLTLQNRKARGANRYAVVDKPAKVEWASQNMLVLGFIVVVGMLLHLYNFWFNMMFAELANSGYAYVGSSIHANDGAALIAYTFKCPVYSIIYLVWFVAIWFHITHGFWSAFQTLGLNNKVWFNRWKTIGNVWATIVMLLFAAVVIVFCIKGLTCSAAGCCAL